MAKALTKEVAKEATNKEVSVAKKRFIALDVVRGITIALMIIANNPGSWGHMWSFLEHPAWIGFTLADVIFPTFITCMGFAMVFSLKHVEKVDWLFVRKVILRGLILILIGWFFTGFSAFLDNASDGKDFIENIINVGENFRFTGVFFRLGLVSLLTSAIIVLTKKNLKIILAISGVIIFAYFFVLGYGHGYEFSNQNICYIVDRSIFSEAHIYHLRIDGVRIGIDPEGFLSSIPCIAQTLLAYSIGKIFIEKRNKDKANANLWLFAVASILIVVGLFCSLFSPIFKKVWSPSFVFLTTGIAMTTIAFFSFITIKKEHKKGLYIFNAIGSNALGIYLISSILALSLNHIPVNLDGMNIHDAIYKGFSVMCCQNLETASFLYSVLLLLICGAIALLLYRKKIFIRL